VDAPSQTSDRPCPIGFVVAPAFVGALVWLYALLTSLTPY
jgi:hypothetical protein